MTKQKITISVDERILDLIDRQRGETKRSTYINSILEEHFSPRSPDDKGGGTFVTTLELRKTLKNIHNKIMNMEHIESSVRDLEGMVYEMVYDAKGKGQEAVKVVKRRLLPDMKDIPSQDKATEDRISKWIESVLKKNGTVILERDFKLYLEIEGAEQTVVAFAKNLRSHGLNYDINKKEWYA